MKKIKFILIALMIVFFNSCCGDDDIIPPAEKPIEKDPIIEEPIVEEPSSEEPIEEDPIIEEPTVEEPVFEYPDDLYPVNVKDKKLLNISVKNTGFEYDGTLIINYKNNFYSFEYQKNTNSFRGIAPYFDWENYNDLGDFKFDAKFYPINPKVDSLAYMADKYQDMIIKYNNKLEIDNEYFVHLNLKLQLWPADKHGHHSGISMSKEDFEAMYKNVSVEIVYNNTTYNLEFFAPPIFIVKPPYTGKYYIDDELLLNSNNNTEDINYGKLVWSENERFNGFSDNNIATVISTNPLYSSFGIFFKLNDLNCFMRNSSSLLTLRFLSDRFELSHAHGDWDIDWNVYK